MSILNFKFEDIMTRTNPLGQQKVFRNMGIFKGRYNRYILGKCKKTCCGKYERLVKGRR